MNLCFRALVVLCALWAGCADFKKAEDEFCKRNPVNCGEQPVPPGPASLAFSSAPQTVQVGTCSSATTVELRDAQARPVNATANTVVEVSASPSDGFQFFTQAGCTGAAVTAVTIPAGVSSTSFFFKGTRAGPTTLTAATGSLLGNQTVTLAPAPPMALALSLPASPLPAGTCAGGGQVEVQDAAGSTTRVDADTSVSLQAAPAVGIAFFLDAACSQSVTSVTLRPDAASAPFFMQGQVVGSVTVTVMAPGLPAVTGNVTVAPGAGNQLVFQTAPQTVTAGTCSAVVRVRSQDSQGTPSPVSAATTVALSATPGTGFKFYSAANCAPASEVTGASIAPSGTEASFYFQSTRAGSVTVTVTSPGFTGDLQQETINPGPPTLIAFAGPVTVQAGSCSAAIPVELRDAFGNPTLTPSVRTIGLSAGTNLTFFSNSGCTAQVTSVSVPQGLSSASFYVRSTQATSYTITGSSTGMTSGTVIVTVNPGPPVVLAFTTPQQTQPAGQCSSVVTVQLRDANNNAITVTTPTQVNVSAAPAQGFEFFTQAGCGGTSGTSTTIAAGSNSASFYFRGTRAGLATLSAAANSVSRSQAATINPGPPAALFFSQVPTSPQAGACTQVTLQAQDNFGNPAPVASAQQVSLMANPGAGFTFYLNTTCGTATSSVTVPVGQSSVSFSFRGTQAGTIALNASMGSLTGAFSTINITPLAASKLVFTTPARTVMAEVCSQAVTVRSADSFDNAAPVGANEAVALSENGTPNDNEFNFYSDSNCVTAVTSVTINAGQSMASFYFKGRRARSVPVTANAATLTDATQGHTIVGAVAVSLAFSSTTPSAQLLAGTCALRTVESLDAYGNPPGTPLTLSLSATPMAEFFSDANCTSAIAQVSTSASTGAASFYFKGFTGGMNAAASLDLTAASASPALSTTQNESILPTVRTGTCNIGATASSATCVMGLALSNLSRSFLVFQATNAGTSAAAANVRCYLNGTFQVRCERGDASGGAVNVQWSAAEFPAGVNVQHFVAECVGSTTTVNPTAVSRGSSFLLLSSKRSDTGQGTGAFRVAELTAANEVQIRKGGGPCSSADGNHLQVVEYTGATVQRLATTTLAAGSAVRDVILNPAVAADLSIVLFSYLTDSSNPEICNRALRGELRDNGATLRFSRAENTTANNCATGNITAISWEVVQFPVGTVVQQVTHRFLATETTEPITLQTRVDPSRTLVVMGSQVSSGQVGGEGQAYEDGEIMGEMRARALLNAAGTTVTLTRDSAIASATFTVYVVQLKP